MRIGVVAPFPEVPLGEDIARAFRSAQRSLEDLGAELIEIEAPASDDLLGPFSSIQQAEALEVHRARGALPRQTARLR